MPPLILPTPPPQTQVPDAFPMGRIHAPDGRDEMFRAMIAQTVRAGPLVVLRKHRIFLPAGPDLRWRPQIGRGSCTEEAGTNRVCGWPNPRTLADLPYEHYKLYERAQVLDEWPGGETDEARRDGGPYYEGSSGRAICRALRELGLITEWWNAKEVDELRQLILADTTDWSAAGPVTIGTNWYDSMFNLGDDGYARITPRAKLVGGHQTCVIGANDNRETFYLVNSWPTQRLFRLTYETMRRLLEKEDGDAQFFVEVPNPRRPALNPMEGVLDFGTDTAPPTVGGSLIPPGRYERYAAWAA